MFSLLLAACGSSKPVTPLVTGARPDVVLVTLDTVRADRVGAYGYADARTDTIDTLARDGIRFDRAISPLPLTIPAHATMMTGLLPFHHGIRANGDDVLHPEVTTLAEMLSAEGWVTAASVAAFVTTRQWGFSQGFSAYFDEMPEDGERNYWHTERSGDAVVDDALQWLAGQSEDTPVFLWVHLYDAHWPYTPKGPWAEALKGKPYDAEVAFVDDQVGRLVDAFAGRKVLWVLAGDHGEGLSEHQELTHGLFTYDSTQRVPFIVSGAGIAPQVVRETVSTADLTPTVLRTLGLPVPAGLDGVPQPGTPTVAYAESYQGSERFRLAPHRTVVEGDLKLIATPQPELYDLTKDPGELVNLAADRPADVTRMQGLLAGLGAAPPTAGRAAIDADTVSQLAALGYVSGGGDVGIDPLTLPDPKTHDALLRGIARLEQISRTGTPEDALALLDTLVPLKPDAFELRMRRLPLLARFLREAEAQAFLEETAAMFPDRGRVWVTLATSAIREADFPRALEYAKRAVEVEPDQPAGFEAEVEALLRLKRPDEAVAEAERALARNPRNYGVAALLGNYYLQKKDFLAAEKHLRLAVAGPNPRRAARVQLAMMAVAAGARDDAYKLLAGELKDYPSNRTARKMLIRLYGEDQRWLDQREHLAVFLRFTPQEPIINRTYAQCLFNIGDFRGARLALDVSLSKAPDDPDTLLLHANLLAKEGKREEGLAVVTRANELNAKRIAEAARNAPPPKSPAKSPAKLEKKPAKQDKKPAGPAKAGGSK